MPDIFVMATAFEPSDQPNKVKITGTAIERSALTVIGWECHVLFDALPSEVNTAQIKAASAEFGNLGITVTLNDNKTLLTSAS